MHLDLRIYFHLLEMSVSDKSKINDCFIEDGFALMVGIAFKSHLCGRILKTSKDVLTKSQGCGWEGKLKTQSTQM